MNAAAKLFLVGAVLCGTAAPALAQKNDVLKHTAAWVVNYDADACHLIGTFGEGKEAVYTRLTKYSPDDGFSLMLIGSRVRYSGVDVRVELQLNDEAPVKLWGMAGEVASMPMVLVSYVRFDGATVEDLPRPPVTSEREAAVTQITARIPGKRAFTLQTGPMDRPMAAMRDCANNLVESWGYDPDVQAALTTAAEPINPPSSWISSSDYPAAGIENNVNGIVRFRLDIDETGTVTGCKALARTEPDVFGKLTCDVILKRARFHPATDAAGVPVRSLYLNSVVWRTR